MSEQPSTSRFQHHLEQGATMSRRTAIFGALGAVFLAACGDESALLSETSSDASVTTTTTSSSSSSETSDAPAASADDNAGDALDAAASVGAAEMVVGFTYTMSSDGKQEYPYIAVWLEDTNGDLVDTIAVWFEQGDKGTKWLPDLTTWYSEVNAVDADYTTASGATRAPGTYSVSWQGGDGAGVPVGDYFLNIEAVREKGPTSLIRESISVAGAASVGLADDGELSAGSVELVV